MTNRTLYGIAESAFHGGGILYTSKSPREVYRAMNRFSDGCFDGRGCQGYVVSPDGGETWYPTFIERNDSAVADYQYANMGLSVDSLETATEVSPPLRPARETGSAKNLALAD